MYHTSDIRKGLKIEMDHGPWMVIDFQFVKPGKGQAFTRTKLRNLLTGNVIDRTFKSGESLEPADISEIEMQYLYNDQDGYHFMDTESYEQMQLTADTLGDGIKYIIPDATIMMQTHEGNPLGIELPPVVTLKVVETPPGVKDATASAQRKPAKMETGLVVQVPAFINEGENLRINTLDGSYSDRAK